MNEIPTFYTHAALALAAYGNFARGTAPSTGELRRVGMSEIQAARFAENWLVVDQYTDGTGLSASVFENSGKRNLAVRGTDPSILDLTVDFILANGFPPQLNPQYQSLKGKIQEWTSNGILSSTFSVAGHSLGGYLADAVGMEYGSRVEAIYSYNAPGVNAGLVGVTNVLLQTLGIIDSGPLSNLYNLRATSGYSLIANLGRQLASPILIETEFSLNPLENHSIVSLVDSLGIYDLFAKLDPALNTTEPAVGIGKITDILKAASNKPALSLEVMLDSLRKLFKDPSLSAPSIVPSVMDNREQYYQNLIGLQDRMALYAGTLTIDSLTAMSDAQLAGLAQGPEAIAYRYALKELNPFAIVGNNDLYSPHNANGELNLYSPVTGIGLTREYLADRAEMLGWKNLSYQKDGNVALRGDRIESYQFTDRSIKDDRTGQDLTLTVVGRNSRQINNPAKIIFGGDADETLVGGNVAAGDHLYGGGGADTLQGNQGNDYLEGGSGNDTYVWNTGDGFDTILDTDGIGTLVVNGKIVSGGIKVAQNDYISADKQQTLHFEGNPLTGGVLIVNGDLRIKNFTAGDLGIVLNDQDSMAEIQPTVTTFQAPFATGTGFGTDGPDHYIAYEGSFFSAKGGDDLFEGKSLSYFDGFFADAGNDILIGRALFSLLGGGSGSDIILGGPGPDQLYGDFLSVELAASRFTVDLFEFFEGSDSEPLPHGYFYNNLYPERPDKDIFFPGGYFEALRYVLGLDETTDLSTHYDDYLDGGDESDLIVGGFGSDVLFGGAGDDSIDGDGFTAIVDQNWNFDELRRNSIAPLFGRPDDDYLDGGLGNDQLVDQDGGNDMLIGGDGNDVLTSYDPPSSESYVNYLIGGVGEDRLLSENLSANGFGVLEGGPGNDKLTVQSGSAYLEGGSGNDIYSICFSLDTRAVINDHDDGTGGSDRLALSFPDLPTSEPIRLSITRDEWNLYLGAGGAWDLVTIENWFAGNANKIEQLTLNGAMVAELGQRVYSLAYDVAAIEDRFATPTEGADFLWGANGDDEIRASGGNDTLVGNEGNDRLDGGAGSDTYVFNLGDGVDTIADSGMMGTDTVAFGTGITPGSLLLGLGSLLIRVGSNGDAIHIEGFDPNDALTPGSIEQFSFADGTVLTHAKLLARGFDFIGTARDDVIAGTSVDDRIDGGAGKDLIFGGAGNDTYFFGRGFGQDIIEDLDTTRLDTDTVRAGFAVTPADMTVTRASDFITLAIDGTGDQLSIRWQPEAGYAVEQVVFADGTLWDAATLEAIAVSSGNTEPTVAIALPDQTVNEDAAFSFVVPEDTFSDPGDALTLSATLAEGALLPAWISFDAASRTFSGTPGNADVGAFDVTVAATDTSGLSASDTFHLTVANTNDAPTVAKAISDQNATEDAAFSFTVPTNTFADVDAWDTLTYSATLADGSALPAWLSFNAATRTFSGTPVNDDVGAFNMTVTVTDSEGVSVSDTFRLTVANTNDTPVLGHPIADQSTSAGVAFDFTLATDAFRDIDRGDVLAYRATLANGDPLPAWLSFDAASRHFEGTPAAGDVGAISIRVTASDVTGASATDDFRLVVSDGGKHHEVNPVETDHYDDRGHDHRRRDYEDRRTPHGRKHFDRDDDRSDRKGYRITDCLATYVESKPRYDFEALAHELERSDGHGEALNAQEIARRWRVVGQYASALSNEHEEDARGGADYHFNDLGLPGAGAFGGGFGYSGSIGALRRVANLQTLQGLEEGFQRLHA